MKTPDRRWPALLALLVVLGLLSSIPASSATFNVTTTDDGVAGSLRQAIQAANARSGPDTIVLPAGRYILSRLGPGEDAGATGDLDVLDDLTLQGAGAGRTLISMSLGAGNSADRVLEVAAGVTVSISGVTISRGVSPAGGGGIRSQGNLTLTDCSVEDNLAQQSQGGGISQQGGSLTLVRSLVANNGGVNGAGILAEGATVALTNSTVSSNTAFQTVDGIGAGMLLSNTTATLTSCTIAANIGNGAGTGIFNSGGTGTVTLRNTLLANGPPRNQQQGTDGNCAGQAVVSAGNNISSDRSCEASFTEATDRNDVEPLVLPLGNYGGPVRTHALRADSPAVNAGDTAAAPPTDARGVARAQGPRADVGAFELEAPAANSLAVTNTNDSGPGSLREAIRVANSRPGADVIDVPAGTYTLQAVGRGEDDGDTGDLDILDNLTLRGAGPDRTIINAANVDRAIDALSPVQLSFDEAGPVLNVSISGMAVRGGRVDGDGAGIRVDGNAAITRVAFSDNITSIFTRPNGETGEPSGGGLASIQQRRGSEAAGARLRVEDCTFTENRSPENGGGAYMSPGNANDVMELVRCTFTNNRSGEGGGGATMDGSRLTIQDCTFTGNQTGDEGGGGASCEGGDATITGSTFRNNRSGDDGGGGFENGGGNLVVRNCTFDGNTAGTDGGGGFENEGGDLEVTDATVTNNVATFSGSGGESLRRKRLLGKGPGPSDGGGGFENEGGTLQMTRCVIRGNRTDGNGGGVENEGGSATITDCTVADNQAGGTGGGINNEGATTLMSGTTLSGNRADQDGGGLHQDGGEMDMTNCTVSGNTAAARGGGLFDPGQGLLLHVTIAGNGAQSGGGIFHEEFGGVTAFRNTLVANSTSGGNYFLDGGNVDGILGIRGRTVSEGNNLSSDATMTTVFTEPTDQNNVNPRLGSLANNGGRTQTHALLAGSPAIDRGNNANAPATDQRGTARPIDGDRNGTAVVDIGAFEAPPGQPAGQADLGVTLADAPDPVVSGRRFVYTATVTNNGPDAATGARLTHTLPDGVTFVSATPAPGSRQGNVLTFNLGRLARNASSTVRVTVTAGAPGQVTSTASVTATEGDPTAGNNTASAATTINEGGGGAGRVSAAPDPVDFGTVKIGDTARRRIRIRSVGGDVRVTVVRPARPFGVGSRTVAVQDGRTRFLAVEFRPTREGRFSQSLVLRTGNPAQPRVRVRLIGRACRRNPFDE